LFRDCALRLADSPRPRNRKPAFALAELDRETETEPLQIGHSARIVPASVCTDMRKVKSTAVQPALATAEGFGHPEVIVDFHFDHGLFHVAVANVSNAPAYRVTVSFDKKFRGLGGRCEVSSLRMFRRIEFLAPHQRVETFLDTSSAYFQRREPTRIAALISYRDGQRRGYERHITHDLSIYKDVAYLVKPAETHSRAVPSSAPAPVTATGEQHYGSLKRKTLLQFQFPG
jgi:hypothetical protein